jgi:predicted aminopeptidase
MTIDELDRRLAAERFVSLAASDWTELAGQCEEVERHNTFLAGDLVIVRIGDGLAAVEEPAPGTRIVRRLADLHEVRRFVDARLETYDNMWNGCGCKVDYRA